MPTPAKKTAKAAVTVPAEKPVKAAAKKTVKAAPAEKPVMAAAKTPAKATVAGAKKAAPAKTAAKKKAVQVAPEQRRNYIEIAAYYIAERHGFMSGRDAADWAEAEAEIDRLLGGGHFNP